MPSWSQGDIIRISGRGESFVVVSNNAYLTATGRFHVCLMTDWETEGPTHIRVKGIEGTEGTVSCEQIKLIDPNARGCRRVDRLPYRDIMEISDVIQGIFEYD